MASLIAAAPPSSPQTQSSPEPRAPHSPPTASPHPASATQCPRHQSQSHALPLVASPSPSASYPQPVHIPPRIVLLLAAPRILRPLPVRHRHRHIPQRIGPMTGSVMQRLPAILPRYRVHVVAVTA